MPERRVCAGVLFGQGQRDPPPQSTIRAIARKGWRKSWAFVGVPSGAWCWADRYRRPVSCSPPIHDVSAGLHSGSVAGLSRWTATLRRRSAGCAHPQTSEWRSEGHGDSTVLAIIWLAYAGCYGTFAEHCVRGFSCGNSLPTRASSPDRGQLPADNDVGHRNRGTVIGNSYDREIQR